MVDVLNLAEAHKVKLLLISVTGYGHVVCFCLFVSSLLWFLSGGIR